MSSELNHYFVRAILKTPLHIGTGETYDPISFIIDKNIFYCFDEVLFYHALPDIKKQALDVKINSGDFMQIVNFYKDNKDIGKEISHHVCSVTSKIQSRYDVKNNKDNTASKNQWAIYQTFKNPNSFRPIIPGSSIKGMLGTILKIYSPLEKEDEKRQALMVSDALCAQGETQIGYCYRKHKNPEKEAKNPIPAMVEVVRPGAEFLFSIKTTLTWNELLADFSSYYQARENSFYTKLNKNNVVRVGKFSGKEFMVDSMSDAINTYGKSVSTHTLYEVNDEPFGWMELFQIDENIYKESLSQIQEIERKCIDEILHVKKSIMSKIEDNRIQKREAKAKFQAVIEAEAKQKEVEEQKRKEELSKLSPLEREIEDLCEANPSVPKDTLLFLAIQDGGFESNRKEALEYLCNLMEKNGNWKESGKPPKKVQRTQQVLAWLKGAD